MMRWFALAEVEDVLADLAQTMFAVSAKNFLDARAIATAAVGCPSAVNIVDLAVVALLPFKFLEVAHDAAHDGFVLAATASFYVGGVAFCGLLGLAVLVLLAGLQQNRGVTQVEDCPVDFDLTELQVVW